MSRYKLKPKIAVTFAGKTYTSYNGLRDRLAWEMVMSVRALLQRTGKDFRPDHTHRRMMYERTQRRLESYCRRLFGKGY